ncbi:MAG: site-specific integrase, partial [Malacoplasma sp.]|nr:site-specific integrase [Malacoplasma sp.]
YVSFEEYKQLINFVKNHKTTNISLIIIRLLFETGIRSSELLNIKTSDVFNNRIRIYGKNRLERFVFVCDSLAKIINDLKIKKIKNNNHKLFSIGYKALYKRINNLSKRINKKLSPHMFRRGFATHCTLQNIGIYQISQMMGHENINTTKNYIKCNLNEEIMATIFK